MALSTGTLRQAAPTGCMRTMAPSAIGPSPRVSFLGARSTQRPRGLHSRVARRHSGGHSGSHSGRRLHPALPIPSSRTPSLRCRAEQQQPGREGPTTSSSSSSSSSSGGPEVSTSPEVADPGTEAGTQGAGTADGVVAANGINSVEGQPASSSSPSFPSELLEGEELVYRPPGGRARFWTSLKLAFALPWRRFKKDSVLSFTLEGNVSDQERSRFDPGLSMPAVCGALRKAAHDPRVQGVALEVGPLSIGWGKVMEIKRHIDYFRSSGKYIVCWMKQGAEKEYYLASACSEVYSPPGAYISLRGFVTGGSFLRGVLDKVGVEPQVRRIGPYKSAGDQLLRTSMAPEQREQLTAIQADVVEEFLRQLATARGKTREEVVAFMEEGVYDMERFRDGGWLDGLWYEDQLLDELKMRTTGLRPKEGETAAERQAREKALAKPLRRVGLRKYASVSPSAFGLAGGKKRIVVLRTAGGISGGKSAAAGGITPNDVIPKLRALAKDKSVAAVVLRVDSPGGDALSSDLMWREVRLLDGVKPVVASMGDVAASGGYYMAMAARTIVAEALTLTGSIGVVAGKFNLAPLYGKIGYNKELISWGRFAELLADNRTFTPEEEALFDASALHAYTSFRDKAAASRGMTPERMQGVAQGRVWSGGAAKKVGLVDALGGVNRAVALARHAAGIPPDEAVTVVEMGRVRPSPVALLLGSNALAGTALLLGGLLRGQSPVQTLAAATGTAAVLNLGTAGAVASADAALPAVTAAAAAATGLLAALQHPGRCSYLMTDVDPLTVAYGSGGSNGSYSTALGDVDGALAGGGGGGGAVREFLSEAGEEGVTWGGPVGQWLETVLSEW